MRRIDGDALIEFIENRYDITWKDDYEGGIKDACTDIIEKISKMPTIEPERKKGEWIEDGYYDLPCVCSYCGTAGERKWNFCPNCGADMRGDDDE